MLLKNGLLTALVALVVGLLIYVCFYPESVWLNYILQTNINESLNLSLPYQAPTALVYSIPTGLWAYSFIVMLFSISSKLDYSFYVAISAIFLPELLQHNSINLIPGTFDYCDLIANLTGVTVAIFLSVKTN